MRFHAMGSTQQPPAQPAQGLQEPSSSSRVGRMQLQLVALAKCPEAHLGAFRGVGDPLHDGLDVLGPLEVLHHQCRLGEVVQALARGVVALREPGHGQARAVLRGRIHPPPSAQPEESETVRHQLALYRHVSTYK